MDSGWGWSSRLAAHPLDALPGLSCWTPSRVTISPSSPRLISYFPAMLGDVGRSSWEQGWDQGWMKITPGDEAVPVPRPFLRMEAPARREGVGPAAAGTQPGATSSDLVTHSQDFSGRGQGSTRWSRTMTVQAPFRNEHPVPEWKLGMKGARLPPGTREIPLQSRAARRTCPHRAATIRGTSPQALWGRAPMSLWVKAPAVKQAWDPRVLYGPDGDGRPFH